MEDSVLMVLEIMSASVQMTGVAGTVSWVPLCYYKQSPAFSMTVAMVFVWCHLEKWNIYVNVLQVTRVGKQKILT